MRDILMTLLSDNFVYDQDEVSAALEPYELELLNELLWFLSNLSNVEIMAN